MNKYQWKRNKARVTAAQQGVLCSFFEKNPEVIRGYKKKPNCIEAVQLKWKKITPSLNALGPPRHHKAWAKYLSDLKAKLKRKRIKWRQKSDGTGPLICNADEFNEIGLRMLQVLREDAFESQDLQDSEGEQNQSFCDDMARDNFENERVVTPTKRKKSKHNETTRGFSESTSTNDLQHELELKTPTPHLNMNPTDETDEFDSFGRNIAQQLRSLPLAAALETQELLLCVLREQRLKVLSGTTESQSYEDPLEKR